MDKDALAKLKAAQSALEVVEVKEKLDALPTGDAVKADDKTAIKEAIEAYEALSHAEKEQIPADTVSRLEEAKTALEQLEAEEVAHVNGKINDMPGSNEITAANKEQTRAAVEEARAAYDELSEDQQKNVDKDALAKLEEAESALEVIDVKEKLDSLLPDVKVTSDDKDDIEAAREAYEALSDEEKEQIPQDALNRLETAEVALAVDMIDDLPSGGKVTKDNKEAIEEAKAVYEALTEEQKTEVGEELITKLKEAESALAVVETKEAISSLPAADKVTAASKEAVEAAREAYEALSDEEKEQIPKDALNRLETVEVALAVDMIDDLPSGGKVTKDNKEAIEAAKAAYDALTDDQKEKVSADILKKLADAEDKLVILQAMSEVSAKTGSDVIYTGNPLQLINTPTTRLPEGYTMKYAVTTTDTAPTDESAYTTSIPTGTNAGTYYVWCDVAEDGNHEAIEPFCITVEVAVSGIMGDVNGDGIVDIADALMISRYDVELVTLNKNQLALGDITGDGSVDIADALYISRLDAGLLEE